MLYKKTYTDIITSALKRIVDDGRITNVGPGSIVRLLLETMAEELSFSYDVLQLNHAMSFISTASGVYLDLIGEGLLGTLRSAPAKASVSMEDKNIRFYTDTGASLVSVLGTNTIPANTTISNFDGAITFSTTMDVTVDDVQASVFVPAESAVTGSDFNVGPNILTTHGLGVAGISVTNTYSVVNGGDIETDSNYRFRLANSVRSYARANAASVRLAALSVEGVADVRVTDARSGAGTFDILLIPSGNIVSPGTIRRVRSAVGFVKALGVFGAVRQPNYVPTELSIKLTFTANSNDANNNGIKRNVTGAILRYLGEIPLGGLFVLNELRQRVMDESSNILDMDIICYRFRRRPQLLRNYQLGFDELLIPDPNVSEAISVV